MTSPGNALVRRRDRRSPTQSRRSPNQNPSTDDDSEYSRCPSPLLAVDSGYRVDPFTAFPIDRPSRGVRFMADYYAQIWAPQQASASTVTSGGNVLLTIIPLVFQDSMLFEATITMTRAAWVLRRGMNPLQDKMTLRHRLLASKALRASFNTARPVVSDTVLLTIATMLTMNYMINDIPAFEVHLNALEHMLRMTDQGEENEIRAFVRGRALAFGVLASFVAAHQPSYATRINEVGHRISTLTYPDHPFLPEISELTAKLPIGLSEVVLSQSIAIEFISFLVKLTELFKALSQHQEDRLALSQPPMTIQRAIYDLQCLSALPLTHLEKQLVRALLAFCLHIYNEMSFRIPLARPLRPILEAFNADTDLTRNPWIQRCLFWCSIVIASAWDRQDDATPQKHELLGHALTVVSEGRNWEDTKEMMQKFLWMDNLEDEWEVCWRAACFAQQRQRRGASHAESMSQMIQETGHVSETTSSSGDGYDNALQRWERRS